MKKRRVISLLIAALLIVVLGSAGTGSAKAAGGVKVTVTATPGQLSAAGNVDLRISIENGTDSTMQDVSVLGNGVNEILAPIAAGATQNVYIEDYPIAENKIGKTITFTVSYTQSGSAQTASGSVTVSRLEIAPDVVLERTSDVSIQEIGKPVKFTYSVYNEGVTKVSSVIVRDTFTDEALNAPFALNPGKSKKIYHTFTMEEDMASRPSVSFVSNGKNYVNTIDVLYITTPEDSLTVEVSASKTEAAPDEEITVTCKVSNKIGQTIRDISVADETGQALGDSFDLGAMQQKTVTKTVKLTADRDFAVSAIGYVNGSKVEASSEPVKLHMQTTDTQTDLLKIIVEPSLTQLDEAGTVTFSITVSNLMEDTLTDVVVSEKSLGEIAKFDSLGTGDKLVTKDSEVTADQTFVFTVTAVDESGDKYIVDSDNVEILVGPHDTLTPSPADAASGGLGTFLTIVLIIVGMIVVAGVVLTVLLVQERKAKKRAAAAPPLPVAGTAAATPQTPGPEPEPEPEPETSAAEAEDESFIPPEIEEEGQAETKTPAEEDVIADTAPDDVSEPGQEKEGEKGIDDIENPIE